MYTNLMVLILLCKMRWCDNKQSDAKSLTQTLFETELLKNNTKLIEFTKYSHVFDHFRYMQKLWGCPLLQYS